MNKRITDVVEPYEDEILYSWTIRMLKLYSYNEDKSLTNCKNTMQLLFGENVAPIPSLLYKQKGLDYFVKNCGLEDSEIFFSEKAMIETLTLIPFYKPFVEDDWIFKSFHTSEQCNFNLATFIGRDIKKIDSNGEPIIKFCSECIREKKKIYLKKEHKIIGNRVCYKHKKILNYMDNLNINCYSLNGDFITRIENNDFNTFRLSEEEFNTAIGITDIIHEIYLHGLKINIKDLKKKIQNKLFEINFLTEEREIVDIEALCEYLNVDFLYKSIPLKEILPRAMESFIRKRSDPLIYFILIYRLFGNLENMHAYTSDFLDRDKALFLKEYSIIGNENKRILYG